MWLVAREERMGKSRLLNDAPLKETVLLHRLDRESQWFRQLTFMGPTERSSTADWIGSIRIDSLWVCLRVTQTPMLSHCFLAVPYVQLTFSATAHFGC